MSLLTRLRQKQSLVLLLIIFMGFVVRLYDINTNPPGFFADEADIGYRAWQLIHGEKIAGYTNPMYVPAFQFYRPALPVWFTTLTVGLFGLNEFAVRLASVIIGALTIWTTYLMTYQLTKRASVALLSAALVAMSPWHIHMSRVGFEGIYLTFFQTLGIWLLLRKRINPGAAVLGLSVYAYHPAILQSTALFVGILLFVLKKISWKQRSIAVLVFLITLIPFFHGIKSGVSLSRLSQVSLFEKQTISPSEKVKQFMSNYTAHFSHEFLFSKGDIGMPKQFITRHSVRDMGELYNWQLPFLLVGCISLCRRSKRGSFLLLLGWFFVYPLGSALTLDVGPQATRSIIGVIPFQVLTAIGLLWVYEQTMSFANKKLSVNWAVLAVKTYIITLFTAVTLFSTGMFLYRLFVQYPLYAADFWGWQFGSRDAVALFMSRSTQYDSLYLQPEFNAPHIFFNFFDPHRTCVNCQVGWMHEQIGGQTYQLFAVTPTVFLENRNAILQSEKTINTIGRIYYPNGTVAFLLIETISSL